MRSNIIWAACAAAFAFSAMGTQAVAQTQSYTPKTERGQLVHQIVKKWGPHVQEAYKVNMGTWAKEMGPAFGKASIASLREAADAKNFDSMNADLLGTDSTKSLGDAAADLVFVPVSPCRLFDTRLAGGAIAANTVRGIDVTAVSNYSFQGGASNDCNGVGAAGSFAAAAVNLTVVSPSGAGYLTAFPTGGTQPVAATVNYASGAVVGNLAIVALDQGASANEMNIYSYATTHVVGDIVGYFINPQATAVQCTTVQTSYSVPAGGSFNGGSPTCPVGYNPTGGGCFSAVYAGRVVSTYPNGASHFCSWQNEGAVAMNAVAMQTCCRVPGR